MQKQDIRFTLRLVHELDTRLGIESQRLGISKNSLIVNILWDHVKKQELVLKGLAS